MLLSHKMRSAIARKDPVNIILNERSQKEKATYCNPLNKCVQSREIHTQIKYNSDCRGHF